MKNLLIFTFMFIIIFAGNALAQKNCVVVNDTTAHVDKKTMAEYLGAYKVGRETGNMTGFWQANVRLSSQKRILDADAGEKAEIVVIENIGDESVAQVKIPGKGSVWIETRDLKCK